MRCETAAEYSYFTWLIGKARAYQMLRRYENTLRQLHETDYVWTLPFDEDRARKGVYLRTEFERETGMTPHDGDIDSPCSMLELMVALAVDCDERLMWNADDFDRTYTWFYGMFCNLGLTIFAGSHYDRDAVAQVIFRFLTGQYDEHGYYGGMFFTDRDDVDIRQIDLWYQLMLWIDCIAV